MIYEIFHLWHLTYVKKKRFNNKFIVTKTLYMKIIYDNMNLKNTYLTRSPIVFDNNG